MPRSSVVAALLAVAGVLLVPGAAHANCMEEIQGLCVRDLRDDLCVVEPPRC